MEFTKIRYNGTAVELHWNTSDHGAVLTTELTSKDPPRAEFIDAFKPFGLLARALIAPEDWKERIVIVTGVSIKTKAEDEEVGIVLTARVDLPESNSPFLFNTPFLRSPSESHPEGSPGVLARKSVKHLEALEEFAEAYVNGDRAQAALFRE